MDKSLVSTNQSAKMALSRSKSLLDLTNTILDKIKSTKNKEDVHL